MQTIDQAKAARVWQRVQAETTEAHPEQGLLELIAREWTDAATYLQLSRRFQGKERTILRRMYEEEQAHTACLKGIYTLITGTHPTVRAIPPGRSDPETALRWCYGQEMQCLTQYEKRSADPEYGQVFARLSDQKRAHCQFVLELLGKVKK